MNAGASDEAIAKWRQALAQAPGAVEARVGLADSLLAAGQAPEAIEHYRHALRQMPDHAALLYALGTAEAGARLYDDAHAHLTASLALNEQNPHAHSNLATVYRRRGDAAAAARHFKRALELKPDLASARAGLAGLLDPTDRLKYLLAAGREAIRSGAFATAKSEFQNATILSPDASQAWEGLAVALLGLGDGAGALAACDEAIRQDAGNVGARHHKALALRALTRLPEAIAVLSAIIADHPMEYMSRSARGALLMELGAYAEAIPDLATAADHIRQDSRGAILAALAFACHAVGDWGSRYQEARRRTIAILSNADADAGAMVTSPFHLQPLGIPLEIEKDMARRASAKALVSGDDPRPSKRQIAPGDKLRIGYISADFHGHSIAWAIKDLIPAHDRARFAVEGFALNRQHDETTRYFAGVFDVLHDIAALDDAAAARHIAGRGIDILIDLAGHTRGGRLEILARRPAPVQLHAFGYGRPICAPYIPWRITDRISTPPATRHLFDETLIDLPHNALPTAPPPAVEDTLRRADIGLPDDTFVFANLGGTYKIEPESFDQWMAILKAVPNSLLMLLRVNEAVETNLSQAAEARGVAAARLVFAPYVAPARHHGRYRLVDLCLDTLTHNGGVTTTDALWAGTPVLTTYRADMPDRTGASLLQAADMAELVAADNAEFVAKAIQIATTSGEAARLRQAILARQRTAALFDTEKYTRNFEAALLDLWARAPDTPPMDQSERNGEG